MPLYTTRNKTSGEVKDVMVKMSEKDQYLLDHPEEEFIITQAPSLGDAIRLGIKKPDDAFKDRLREIHKNVPGSTLKDNSRYI